MDELHVLFGGAKEIMVWPGGGKGKNVVAKEVVVVEVVGDHNDGEFLGLVEGEEVLIERLFGGEVEVVGWFVKNEDGGSGAERAGKEDFLALAAREIAEVLVRECGETKGTKSVIGAVAVRFIEEGAWAKLIETA